MVRTTNRLEALREGLSLADPAWQEKLRAELDELTPGWESFPLLIWDEERGDWVTVTLLANPEAVSQPPVGPWGLLRRWLKR